MCNKNLKEEIDVLEAEKCHQHSVIDDLRAQVEALEEEIVMLKKSNRQLNVEVKKLEVEVTKYKLKYEQAIKDDSSDDEKFNKLTERFNELEEKLRCEIDSHDHCKLDLEELQEKYERLRRNTNDSDKWRAEMNFYKEKHDHVVRERSEWEAKYHSCMKTNRVLKEKHTTLKITVKSAGHAVSSSSSSSSDSH